MAEQEDICNTLKRRNAEDGSEGHSFDGTLLPKMLRTVYCKQKEIAEKQDLLSSLLKRGTKKISTLQNELTLVAEIIQEVKTELNQIERIFNVHTPSASDQPPASNLNDHIPVTPLEGVKKEKSIQDALQHAEQMIRDHRQQLDIQKPTERGDAQLVPSNGAIIQHEEHKVTPVSIVGHENTLLTDCTVIIFNNSGEKLGKVENPQSFEMQPSLLMALHSSRNEEPALKQPTDGMLPSSGGTIKSVQENSWILASQEEWNQNTRSVVHSNSISTVFLYLASNVGHEWKSIGRALQVPEEILVHIQNMSSIEECTYQMLVYWKQSSGSAATYNALIRALQGEHRADLAEDLLYQKDLW